MNAKWITYIQNTSCLELQISETWHLSLYQIIQFKIFIDILQDHPSQRSTCVRRLDSQIERQFRQLFSSPASLLGLVLALVERSGAQPHFRGLSWLQQDVQETSLTSGACPGSSRTFRSPASLLRPVLALAERSGAHPHFRGLSWL